MKRNLIIVCLLSLSSLTAVSQGYVADDVFPGRDIFETSKLRKLHKQYIEYCNETVTDTIEEYGELSASKQVPIYGSCNDIIGYREVTTGDTTWKGYKCKEYLGGNVYIYAGKGISITSDTLSWNGWGYQQLRVTNVSCKVTRKHICHVKREKPSSEGFYEWLYKQIKNE